MRGLGRAGLVRLVGLAWLVGIAGCSNTPTAATSTSTTTSIAPITSPMTETYSTLLTPKGTASRAFSTHGRGTVTATLTSTTPANFSLGFGVGIPKANGGGCSLATSLVTGPGSAPQISITAETGQYCVQVYDPGTMTDSVTAAVSITHP